MNRRCSKLDKLLGHTVTIEFKDGSSLTGVLNYHDKLQKESVPEGLFSTNDSYYLTLSPEPGGEVQYVLFKKCNVVDIKALRNTVTIQIIAEANNPIDHQSLELGLAALGLKIQTINTI